MAHCALSDNYTVPAAGGSMKADNVTFTWMAYEAYEPKLLITWSQPSPGKHARVHNVLGSVYYKMVGYLSITELLESMG